VAVKKIMNHMVADIWNVGGDISARLRRMGGATLSVHCAMPSQIGPSLGNCANGGVGARAIIMTVSVAAFATKECSEYEMIVVQEDKNTKSKASSR
jgi:hypothetical protein